MKKAQAEQSETTILSGFAKDAESAAAESSLAVNDHVYISKDMGDSILITTAEGDVVVNTGLPGHGGRHKARFATVSSNPLAYIILTQCHANQFGGAAELRGPDTRLIAQAQYPECRRYWIALDEFYTRRSGRLWGQVLQQRAQLKDKIQEVTPDILFADSHCFELGGRRFELYATPGGESVDALVVWLPQDQIAVVGNLFGPIFGHLPNLYTLRGDKIRSALRFVQSLDRVLALQPATIITGHEVITGEERITEALTRLRSAVLYLYNKTIEGMNAGSDVHTLMRDIKLPDHLQVGQGHGKAPWCVRAIWEEYAGWFHFDSTTSLYGVPAQSIAGDLVELAGGANNLADRAQRYLDRDKPLQAIHLLDIALHAEPDNRLALQIKLKAHELLLQQSGGENFSEVMWLKSEINSAQQALDQLQPKESP